MDIGWMTVDWFDKVPESSGFYRCFIPYKGLARQGHTTTVGHTLKATRFGWGVVNPRTNTTTVPDVLIIQRWMDAEAPHAVRWARKRGQVVLADMDDWMFGLHAENIAAVQMRRQAASATSLVHYADLIREVDGVICSTPFLAEKVRTQLNRNVAVVRNAIDLTMWDEPNFERGPNPGWAGAVHWRSHDLEQLKGIIGQVLDVYGLDFVHLGFDGDDGVVAQGFHVDLLHERLGVDRNQILFTRGGGPLAYLNLLVDSFIGIGVVPLNDHPFNHAKSTAKGMEYAAAGIPFIASDLPEYRWMLESHGIGLVARKPTRWLRHFKQLIEDEALRHKVARENHLRLQGLDIATTGHAWIDAIEALVEGACYDEPPRAILSHVT